jgi:hypothetical protein
VEICRDVNVEAPSYIRTPNQLYQRKITHTCQGSWGEPYYGPSWKKIDIFTSVRHAYRRSRHIAGTVVIMKSLFYSSQPPILLQMNRYIINSDFDIISFGDYGGSVNQHIVRGRPQVTIALEWRPSFRHDEGNWETFSELVRNFAPRKIYFGVSGNRRVKNVAKILSDFESLWKKGLILSWTLPPSYGLHLYR